MDSNEIDDFLSSGFWEISPERRNTRRACREVLERLPGELVEQIVFRRSPVILMAPGKEWGLTRPMSFPYQLQTELLPSIKIETVGKTESSEEVFTPKPHYTIKLSIVYLSPDLEDQQHPVILAVVVHELAHAISRKVWGEEAERKADDLTRQWGFGRELEALREANPRHRY